ncbi:MAG: PilZ domain-containing protein [Phycisphaerales bacterium]
MPSDFGLTVRRHERHALSLAALVGVADHPAPCIGVEAFMGGRLRFSPESGVSETGMPGTVVDLGAGGLGLKLPLYLPRGSVLRVRVLGEDGSVSRLRLDLKVRVQRVTMVDRKPTYLIGTSFVDASPAALAAVKKLIEECGVALAAASAAGGGGGGAA